MIVGGKADETIRGAVLALSSQADVREGTALSSNWRVLLNSWLEAQKGTSTDQVTGVGPKPFQVLQKAGKGLEFNNLARRFASFFQFESSKVE
jgi:hypothetical protein